MAIIIGSLNLDNKYSVSVSSTTDYFKTQAGEIIGGIQVININGTVSVSDTEGGSSSGALVMQRLAEIRNLGQQTQCVDVSIPQFYSGNAKIANVQIEQGPDPTWVNRGAFSIEIHAPLKEIPSNSFGLTTNDSVRDLSISESIEIGEDSHGYAYGEGKFSKTFIRFSNSISVRCQSLCPDGNQSSLRILKKLVRYGPTKSIFSQYSGWNKYLQNRSLTVKSDGAIEFSCDMILTPPGFSAGAFVDLSFNHSRSYENNGQSKTISGNIVGLASVGWGDLASLDSTCSASKLSNALSVFSQIKSKYNSLTSWKGITLELILQPNCPVTSPTVVGQCGTAPNNQDQANNCIRPTSSTISISRTEGSINFSFEWGNSVAGNSCLTEDGVTKEITVEVTNPQAQLIEHTLPLVGTLIQNINCNTAKKVSIKSSVTSPPNLCSTGLVCYLEDGLRIIAQNYLSDGRYILINYTASTSTNSMQINQDYIKCD